MINFRLLPLWLQGNNPRYPLNKDWVVSRARLDMLMNREIIFLAIKNSTGSAVLFKTDSICKL
jgi:hypothetical protein